MYSEEVGICFMYLCSISLIGLHKAHKNKASLIFLVTNCNSPKVMGPVCRYSLLGLKAALFVSIIFTHLGSEECC